MSNCVISNSKFLPTGTRSLILEYIELSPDMMTSFERPSCYVVGTEYRAAEDGDVGSRGCPLTPFT